MAIPVPDALAVSLDALKKQRAQVAEVLATLDRTIEGIEYMQRLQPKAASAAAGAVIAAAQTAGAALAKVTARIELAKKAGDHLSNGVPLASVGPWCAELILRELPVHRATVAELFDALPINVRSQYNDDRAAAIEAFRAQIRKYTQFGKQTRLVYSNGVVLLSEDEKEAAS